MTAFPRYPMLAVIVAVACAGSAQAKDGLFANSKGLVYKSHGFELSVGGRLQLDAVHYDLGSSKGDDAQVRRARIEIDGKIVKIIEFRVDREFAHRGGWRNVWIAVEPMKHVELRGGNFVVPFSMEELQNSNRTALMERSHVSSLAPSYSLGGMLAYNSKHFTVSGGYFGKALDSEDDKSKARGAGFAGRVTLAPIVGKRSFVHLAAAYEQRNLKDGAVVRFVAKPGSQFAPSLMRTGRLQVTNLRMMGAEAAYSAGPFLVQGQYAKIHLDRDLLTDLDFNAWYGQATFVVTGRSYDYSQSNGTIGGVRLKKGGALELAARVSSIDLRDDEARGGIGRTYTVGANYYLNRNVRFMVNYARSRARDIQPLETVRKDDLVTGRFQLAF